VRTLIPLRTLPTTENGDPAADAGGWDAAVLLGPSAVAVVHVPDERAAVTGALPELAAAIRGLRAAGTSVLGYLSIAFGGRPVTGLADALVDWAGLGATGVFLDHVPAGPFHLGGVRMADRLARRAGLHDVVLNPGRPVDPMCRQLGDYGPVTMCTFHGSWSRYRSWDGAGAEPGDGHLVYGVPVESRREAYDLIAARGAGLALTTDEPWPPWLTSAPFTPAPADVAWAGSAGRSTTTGS
jgi:hypothetical protein